MILAIARTPTTAHRSAWLLLLQLIVYHLLWLLLLKLIVDFGYSSSSCSCVASSSSYGGDGSRPFFFQYGFFFLLFCVWLLLHVMVLAVVRSSGGGQGCDAMSCGGSRDQVTFRCSLHLLWFQEQWTLFFFCWLIYCDGFFLVVSQGIGKNGLLPKNSKPVLGTRIFVGN